MLKGNNAGELVTLPPAPAAAQRLEADVDPQVAQNSQAQGPQVATDGGQRPAGPAEEVEQPGDDDIYMLLTSPEPEQSPSP
eukprot:12745499-Prorocentrum_lima.AAC.1